MAAIIFCFNFCNNIVIHNSSGILFLIQWLILRDTSAPPGLYIEVVGGALVMMSSFSVPLYDLLVDKCKVKQNWLTWSIRCVLFWAIKQCCVFFSFIRCVMLPPTEWVHIWTVMFLPNMLAGGECTQEQHKTLNWSLFNRNISRKASKPL